MLPKRREEAGWRHPRQVIMVHSTFTWLQVLQAHHNGIWHNIYMYSSKVIQLWRKLQRYITDKETLSLLIQFQQIRKKQLEQFCLKWQQIKCCLWIWHNIYAYSLKVIQLWWKYHTPTLTQMMILSRCSLSRNKTGQQSLRHRQRKESRASGISKGRKAKHGERTVDNPLSCERA